MSTSARPYRGVSAEVRRAQRRTALLDAALDLLGAEVPRPVTMTAVCERAGLTERYFYESFRDRDTLLLELLDVLAVELYDQVVTAFELPSETVEERVHRTIAALVAVFEEDPRKGRVILIEAVGHPSLRARRKELIRAFEELFVERSREVFGDQALPAPEDRLTSQLFVGGVLELLSNWVTGEQEATGAQLTAAATRHFLLVAHR